MLDLKFIRENIDKVKENIANKNEKADLTPIIDLDERRKEIINEVEVLKNQRNVASKEIAMLKKNKENADDKIALMKEVSDKIKSMDEELREVMEKLNEQILRIPNVAHDSVPVGKTEDDNEITRTWGEAKAEIDMNHMDIAKKLGIIDFERGAKVSGAGFSFYLGKGAKLERALINFMIDYHLDHHGYSEIMPPFLVNESSMRGTGQLPKMADDMYHAEKDNMYLIPTAEVPITNYYNGEIIPEKDLPIYLCGYSPCFRREAGSYGKDNRGCLRVHQFNKVEMVKFVKPETSWDELEKITNDAEDILKALEIPYRVLTLCTGDTSFASAKTYDLEIWTPGEKTWLEVSSCSNFTDFQGRRANIRFKDNPKAKPQFVHTLNGSGLATSRLMVAILENNWDGEKVTIPEVLRTYTGFDHI